MVFAIGIIQSKSPSPGPYLVLSSNTGYVRHLIHDGVTVLVSYCGPKKNTVPKSVSPFTGSETSTPVESTLITKIV